MKTFDCQSCGAPLAFKPEVAERSCPSCDSVVPIPQADSGKFEELGDHEFLRKSKSFVPSQEVQLVICKGCGARSDFSGSTVANRCACCDDPLVADFTKHQAIKPRSLLPFKIEKDEAQAKLELWLGRAWLVPNAFLKSAFSGPIRGCFVPFWIYDSSSIIHYTGERGDFHYATETYTDAEGKSQTRQVHQTHWSYASGTVDVSFDEIMIIATESLPRDFADEFKPSDLENLEPYSEELLSGFEALLYDIDPEIGFVQAKAIGERRIGSAIGQHIGGEQQRVHKVDISYNDVTFKLVLLPIWISSFRFKETVHYFIVNGRNGETRIDVPISWIKLLLIIATIVAFVALIVWIDRLKRLPAPKSELVRPPPVTSDRDPTSEIPADAPPEGE